MRLLDLARHMLADEYGKILLWLVFILMLMFLDQLTGFISAVVNKNIVSGKMSHGILKKFALLCVLVIIVPLTILLPNVISTSVIITVYVLETLNELISVLENLTKMGVKVDMFDIVIDKLHVYNNKDKGGNDNGNS